MRILPLLFCSFFLFFAGLMGNAALGQGNVLKDKQVGLYISAKDFIIPEEHYLTITQFLTVGEDRSYAGRLKAEFMIRLGWMLSEQLQEISGADSVWFINADLPKGKAMQQAWNVDRKTLIRPEETLKQLDYILVLSPFELSSRVHKSVFIRSNRMVTDRVNVKMVDFEITSFQMADISDPRHFHICYDEQTSEKPESVVFDFYNKESGLGKYLGMIFSRWWGAFMINRYEYCQ